MVPFGGHKMFGIVETVITGGVVSRSGPLFRSCVEPEVVEMVQAQVEGRLTRPTTKPRVL